MQLKELLKNYGLLYSEELGIQLKGCNKNELFKWFLASLLFGARISENIAKRTYKTFKRYKLFTPKKILKVGWDFLVNPIMKEGHYVRYDGKTSEKILRCCKKLINEYSSDINNLEKRAINTKDLEYRLKEFYGIGSTTARIFLRELRGIWRKADPDIGKFTKLAAKKLGYPYTLKGLKKFWEVHKIKGYDFRHFEAALLRYGKVLYKKLSLKKHKKTYLCRQDLYM